MADDLILILDDTEEVTLLLEADGELVLEDSVPYAQPTLPAYEGPYTVTPVLYDEQELETRNLRMTDNVTVKEIPITQTSNLYGGYTVVIG